MPVQLDLYDMDIEPTNIDRVTLDPKSFSNRELYLILSQVRDVITIRLDLQEKARVLQAIEYDRRLESLNHFHELAKEKERDFLLRAEYTLQHNELERRVESNNLTIVGLVTLPPRLDSLNAWKEEIGKASIAYTTGTLPRLEALQVEMNAQNARIDVLDKTHLEKISNLDKTLGEKITIIDKRIASIYSYGYGAAAVLTLLGVLLNVLIKFAFKGIGN